MNKKEMLESIGFSKEFIEHYENVENTDTYDIEQNYFSSELTDITVYDTSDSHLELSQTDSNALKVKT